MSDCYYRVGEPGFQSGTGSFSFFSNRMPYQAVGFQFHVITFPFTRWRVRNARNISSFFPTETGNMRIEIRNRSTSFCSGGVPPGTSAFLVVCFACRTHGKRFQTAPIPLPFAVLPEVETRSEVGLLLVKAMRFFCVTQMIQTKSMQKLHKKRKILTLVLDICIKIWYNITEQKKWKGHGGNHD